MKDVIDNSENYQAYRSLVLEETEKILSNKKVFLLGDRKEIDRKIVKISSLSDFFYVEGEYEIIKELNNISMALQVRRFLRF
jgi:hypothetical protein